MKILVVNWLDRLNPQAGGAETHLHEVFGRLARRGHSVTLVCSGFPGCLSAEMVDGMEVHRVGTRLTFGIRFPFHLKRALNPEDFDVAVEDLNKVPVFMPLLTRTPVVLLVHHLFGRTAFQEASFPIAAATWILERPVPRVFRGLPVIAVSDSTVQDLRDRGMTQAEIAVVPNGVDLERLTPGDGERFPDPTILYLGRLKRYKGVNLILEALPRLHDRGILARLLVAGKGDHLEMLQELTSRLGLGDTVEFLGYVSEEEKIRLLQRSWLHVLTSPKEGWGISILEAAACGTPTVASRSPGLRDAVLDGETGLLVPHADRAALSDALETLLTDRALRRKMGVQARVFAENFAWEASADRMEAFLKEQVAASHR